MLPDLLPSQRSDCGLETWPQSEWVRGTAFVSPFSPEGKN